jgi:hypothetical protein
MLFLSAANRAAPDIGPADLVLESAPVLRMLVLLFFLDLSPEDRGHLGGCCPMTRIEAQAFGCIIVGLEESIPLLFMRCLAHDICQLSPERIDFFKDTCSAQKLRFR